MSTRRPARKRPVDLTRYEGIIPEWGRFLEAAERPEPTVFRINTRRVAEAELVERLTRQGFGLRSLEGMPGFLQVESEPYPVSLTFEHWHGHLYVQQASTGAAPPALGVRPGERVLDLCSAPGGKTTHLSELMEGRGCLVANEIDERRIRGLLGNVYRLGHTNVLVTAGDGRDFPEGALFDRVLVDAPCSGEGTLRRRSGSPPNQSSSFLGYVTAAQRALLERAVRLTRPGGTILYVTCTFSPDENEAVVSDVLAEQPVELEALDLPVPHAPGVTAFEGRRFDARLEGAARIYPHHLDSGGLFLAKLRRLEGAVPGAVRPGSPDEGWSPVPASFPEPDEVEPDGEGEGPSDESSEAVQRAPERVARSLTVLQERYGIASSAHPEWGWVTRGGRAWLHTAGEWPLEQWDAGSWRAVSIGQRAIEFDSRGRPRPTNDFLRLAEHDVGSAPAVVELSDEGLAALLERVPVPADLDLRGPVALRWRGSVVGRGHSGAAGVVGEIPKARAADLRRALEKRR